MNDGLNAWIGKVLRLAHDNGWSVLYVNGRLPGSITLVDRRGTEVSIYARWPGPIETYVAQFKAIVPEPKA